MATWRVGVERATAMLVGGGGGGRRGCCRRLAASCERLAERAAYLVQRNATDSVVYQVVEHTHTHTHTRLTALFPGLPG